MIHPTSTDYELFYNLLQQGEEIYCFVLNKKPAICYLVEKTLFIEYMARKTVVYSFLYNGTVNMDSFIKNCTDYKLQWIVPTTAYIGEKYTIQIIPRFTKRDCQWIAVVSWKEEVVYYAMFHYDKIETYAYTQPLSNLLLNHNDYCTTIEEALKKGLEIVKQLQAND
jgi:hypothetical protein